MARANSEQAKREGLQRAIRDDNVLAYLSDFFRSAYVDVPAGDATDWEHQQHQGARMLAMKLVRDAFVVDPVLGKKLVSALHNGVDRQKKKTPDEEDDNE